MKIAHNQKSIKILFFFMLLACYLGSTANFAYANLYFSPVILKSKAQKIDADLEDIIISLDTNQTRLGNLSFDRDSFRLAFLSTLQESIIRSAVFDDASKRKVALFVQVRKLSANDREIIISYELIDKDTGKNFYLQYFVTMQERKRISRTQAIIQSIEANLRKFMESMTPATFDPPEEKSSGTIFGSGLFGGGNDSDEETLTRKAVRPAKNNDKKDSGNNGGFWNDLLN